ncbi:hypothetical protein CDAR_521791 [Caerostris darwini]|uniref:Uncharacterized protein n=1 Tax=Caerostris darwini TaxID=1538125 RepID=A0AAV4RUC7_9ARAC|nr:hypothetical protein CDAR_521791 [Caerostris darwini]
MLAPSKRTLQNRNRNPSVPLLKLQPKRLRNPSRVIPVLERGVPSGLNGTAEFLPPLPLHPPPLRKPRVCARSLACSRKHHLLFRRNTCSRWLGDWRDRFSSFHILPQPRENRKLNYYSPRTLKKKKSTTYSGGAETRTVRTTLHSLRD